LKHPVEGAWHTYTENFYNVSTVPKTLIKMLFSICPPFAAITQ